MFRMEQQDGKSRHNKSANMARLVFWGDNMSARDATGQTSKQSIVEDSNRLCDGFTWDFPCKTTKGSCVRKKAKKPEV